VIEDRLAKVFPAQTPAQLIRATHSLAPERFEPGAIILREGQAPDALHIITRGQVDVLVPGPDGIQVVAARMTQGQYFGEVELLSGGGSIATIRAGPRPGLSWRARPRGVRTRSRVRPDPRGAEPLGEHAWQKTRPAVGGVQMVSHAGAKSFEIWGHKGARSLVPRSPWGFRGRHGGRLADDHHPRMTESWASVNPAAPRLQRAV
jgi:hypothetical protein